jgi:hypothetical protein
MISSSLKKNQKTKQKKKKKQEYRKIQPSS